MIYKLQFINPLLLSGHSVFINENDFKLDASPMSNFRVVNL